MSKAWKLVLILILSLAVSSGAFADSLTLRTEINSVSYGVSDFGFGIFPIGTNFEYYKYFSLSDNFRTSALLDIEMQFDVSTIELENYDPATGQPSWKGYEGDSLGSYSRLSSYVQVYLQQGFGTNPVDKSGPMVDLRLTLFSRYFYNMESLSLSSSGPSGSIFNKPPFSSGEAIPAYPWLVGDGNVWNNFLELSVYWYFREWRAESDIYEGAYIELSFEFGPHWLGNSILPNTITSDYYKGSFYFEQYMTVFQTRQENGWNWFTLMLAHYNSAGYTWGDVIPENRIQTDRLRGYLNDVIYLRLLGPQFLAVDCYPVFDITLINSLAFGGVQNDITNSYSGVELISGVNFEVKLKLFGFINFSYQCGYNFIRGFSDEVPAWWQNAEIAFYISL